MRLASLSLLFLLAMLANCQPLETVQAVESATRSDKPNVIVVYTDDQGIGDASCYNGECRFETPNIDRLANEGIRFLDGHCSDTVCTPSRYGLLTGRYAWRTRLKRGVMGAEGQCLIAADRPTIAGLLKSAGYRTAMVGKWHLGMDFPGSNFRERDWSQPTLEMPLDRGFDYFFGIPASLNYGVLAWFEGRYAEVPPTLFTAKKPNARHVDYRIMPPYESSPQETQRVLGKIGMEVAPDFVDNQCLTRFTDEAIGWMKAHLSENESQPFFLYLPLTSPHYPVCPLPEFHGKGEAGGYGEFMIETDYHLGRILDFCDQAGITEDTLVVFTSDNGPEKSWKERKSEFQHASNGIYKEGKRSIYEGGHRVPFIVRWPNGIQQPGRTSDRTVCQTDIFATLADILHVEVPDSAAEDSQSFAGVLTTPNLQETRLPLVHHAANGRFAIRDGQWKLVMPHRNAPFELYQLALDPSETRNVAAVNPEVVKSLTKRMTKIVVQGRTTGGAAQPNDTGYWEDLAWLAEADYLSP